MIGWIRRLRLPACLRRWIDTVRALFHGWSWPYWKGLFGRLFLPRPKPERRVIPTLEPLEAIEAPDNLLTLTAPLGATAAVPTAQSSSQTPDVEQHAPVADTTMNLPTEEAPTLPALLFSQTTAQDSSFWEGRLFLAAADQQTSADDAESKPPTNDPTLDPVMAADNALVDPAAHPDAGTTDGAKSSSHHAGTPADNGVNGTPPNLAGAGGQGPGGPSTPFAGGSGGSGGSGAGPGAAGFTGAELAAMTAVASNAATAAPTAVASNAATAAPAAANAGPANALAAPPMQSVLTPVNASLPAGAAGLSSGGHAAAPAAHAKPADSPAAADPPSQTALTSSVNTSANNGTATFTFTATVTGNSGTPTGSVTFYNGANVLATVSLNSSGVATYTTSALSLGGSFDFTVIYSGDSTYSSSTASQVYLGFSGSGTLTLTGGLNETDNITTKGLISGNTIYGYFGGHTSGGGPINATYTGTISGNSVSGTFSGKWGESPVVHGTMSGTLSGTDSSNTLSLSYSGTYSGTYSGNVSASSTSTINSLSSIALTSSLNPASYNQPVTFTAAVTGNSGTPTGSVIFYDGTTVLSTVSLNANGVATYTTSTLPTGYQNITAVYGGNSTYTGSTAALLQYINPLAWQGPAFTWTQTATANPSVTTPAAQTNIEGDNVSLQVQASGNSLSYDAVDLPPGLSINSSTGLISGTVAYGAAEDFDGSYNPTIIVANNQGGSTQTTFTWTINPAQVAPTLTNPGNQSNLTGDNVSLQINATQVDNDPITYDASNLPDGLGIDPDSGLISGTVAPDAATGTPYAVTVTATDAATNLSTSQTFNWTINPSTAAPVWTAPGDQSNAAGDYVDLQLSAADANGDNLTYTATGLPPGLTFDPIAGIITGTLPNNAASSTPYNVTVTASNGISSSSQTFTWTVNPISLQNPGDQINLDGDAVSLPMSATDASNGTLSYSATGLPPGLSIDSGSGLISGTISSTADTSSPYSVTVTATDGTNSASQSFNWTVAALALNPVDDQENQEGTTVSLQLSATDNVGTPTYSATGLPPGVSINSTTGLISGTVGLGAFGSSPYQVTVTATDGANTSSQSFVWTVTPRVALTNPGPQSSATGDSVSLQVSATSPGGTMSYSATGLPPGLSINSSTGLISGTPTTASSTPYTVTVTANDGTSSSSQTFSWTVSALNLVSPEDQTNNDGDPVSLSLTTGYHGTGTLSYSANNNSLPPGLSINTQTGQITGTISETADTNSPYSVTVTVTDGTNTSSQTFNWTVNPVVSLDSLDDQSNADGDSVSLPVSASDALNNTLTYSATGLPPGLTSASTTGLISGTINSGADSGSPYAVTVTAIDSAGLSATQTFNWNVAAVGLINPGPQASVDDQTVSLQLQGSSGATYTSNGLPPNLNISSTGLISGTLASNADTNSPYVVTVTATLGSNSTSQTFLWTVTPIGLVAPSDQTNTEGDSVSLQLQGLSNGGSLTYSASGLPDGLSLNPTTGLITGTIAPGAAADGPFTVDVAVTNGTVSASQTFNWNVNPVVNLTAPDDQSNNEGDNVSLQVTATDALSNALTYSDNNSLPPGLSIDSSTGLITGTLSAGDAANGPYLVTVTVTDGPYNASQTFDWSVTRTDTTALTMTNPGTQTNVPGDSVNLQINASDPDGDALFYTADGLPEGLGIDAATGIISGTIADGAVDTTPYSVTVTAGDANGQTVSQTFSWLVNDPALTVQVVPINAVEGNNTGPITVATFTTPDVNAQADDFTALINWGDGTTDVGSVNGQNGSFTVTNEYIYAEKGSYPVSVTITDLSGATTTASGTATVADAPLTLTGGFQLGAVPQQSANLTLASFTDGNPSASLSDFAATINWGDGSGTQPAMVAASGDGVFNVSGSHAYNQKGTYPVTITVTDVDGATATATSTVVVGDVYAGIPSNLTVASFTDADTSVPASSFTATIDWGDGTPQSSGTVTGGNGIFTVQGMHTYAQDSIDQPGGGYQVTVTVSDQSGDTLTANNPVTVVRPAATLVGDAEEATQGVALSDVEVASFAEPDVSDGVGEYSATIDWGDGSSQSAGTIVEVSPGVFEVQGSHTYASAGQYTVQVFLAQGWAQYYYVTTCRGLVWVAYNPSEPPSNKPVANDDYEVEKEGTAKGWVLANDQNSASDPLNTKLSFVKMVKAPQHGTVTWEKDKDGKENGHFTYTLDASFKGFDSFTYRVSNGKGEATATVTIGTGDEGYLDFLTAGNPKGKLIYAKQGGYLLQGGGAEVDAAFKWLIERAGGKRIVFLADSVGPNLPDDLQINKYMHNLAARYNLKMGEVEIIDFNGTTAQAKKAAQSPDLYNKLVTAGAIFIEGGDQQRYLEIWQNEKSQVEAALNDAIKGRKTTIGGTSAGLAILGDVVYYNPKDDDGATSTAALSNPFNSQMNFTRDFVNISALQNTVTDTHFGLITYNVPGADGLSDRQRYGRMMVFLARMTQPGGVENLKGAQARGLGVDANTAVLLDPDGVGQVVGSGFAYFLEVKQKKPLILKNTKPPTPLTFGSFTNGAPTLPAPVSGFMVWGGNTRNTVNLKPWNIDGGLPISMWVNGGKLYINGLAGVLPPPL